MSVLADLFPDMAAFRRYVPSVEANVSFDELNASAAAAKKQISNIISSPVFDDIAGADENQGVNPAKECLRSALANCTLARQIVFDVTRNRKSGTDVYRYELQAMQRAFVENCYNALDSLIRELENSANPAWISVPAHAVIDALPIRSTDCFNALYPIDNSYLFFFRTVPFQLEVADDYADYLLKVQGNGALQRKFLRAVAKLTVAKALCQFDILEFPATVRNLFADNNATRSGANEQERLLALARELSEQALRSVADIDLVLNAPDSDNIVTQTSFNEPDDKIIILP
jgi:hypothetical protein